ncbi:hypothetical protein CPB84DRAFT_1798310 [Gymnopilus junonius]|uniref:Uncharacterized protein n=1 Tax=Gymnopilus junonius TaxID=109634 RepID=A0A9P5NA69_GYMJU|nr:hypothetical protein CPB84DRAFT_1798310 [Gymnopilus junonius]
MPITLQNPGYRTCLHNCHVVDPKKSRLWDQLIHLHIYHTSSGGPASHQKTHSCGSDGVPLCPETYRETTNQDYQKFAGRLTHRAIARDLVIQRFKQCWPNPEEAPMTTKDNIPGEIPVDLSLDPNYPTDVPWYDNYKAHHLSVNPVDAEQENELNYLKNHKFEVRPNVYHKLVGAIPWEDKPQRLTCKFVVGYELSQDYQPAHMTTVNTLEWLDESDYKWLAVQNGRLKYIDLKEHYKVKGKVACVYQGMFNLAFEMREHPESWDISFVPWESFKKAMMTGCDCEEWEELASADLVVGGPDFSFDFMGMSKGYGVKGMDWWTIFTNYSDLANKTSVWPDPSEMFRVGAKVHGQQTYEMAALSLGLSMPLSVVCEDDDDVLKYAEKIEKGLIHGVLKRDYSDCSSIVIGTFKRDRAVKDAKKAIKEAKQNWKELIHLTGPLCWILQPLVSTLLHIGEVRTFIVGGILIANVCTTPRSDGVLDIAYAERIRPLHKFQFDRNREENKFSWFVAEDVSARAYDFADSYEKFVLEMVGKVIMLEELRYKVPSDLRIFVRADVSVYRNADTGKYSFFVNEFTRSTTTSLFLYYLDGSAGDVLITTMVDVLHTVASNKAKHLPPPRHSPLGM